MLGESANQLTIFIHPEDWEYLTDWRRLRYVQAVKASDLVSLTSGYPHAARRGALTASAQQSDGDWAPVKLPYRGPGDPECGFPVWEHQLSELLDIVYPRGVERLSRLLPSG